MPSTAHLPKRVRCRRPTCNNNPFQPSENALFERVTRRCISERLCVPPETFNRVPLLNRDSTPQLQSSFQRFVQDPLTAQIPRVAMRSLEMLHLNIAALSLQHQTTLILLGIYSIG